MPDAGAAPIIRIFVSSPSDVMAERERVERIAQRLNAAFAGAVTIETVRWETSYYTASSTFQHQIADPGACDVVVSLFWQRLGSELPPEFECMRDGRPYPSGTVYELTKALQASAQNGSGLPHVLVYRKMADVAVPMSDRERYRQAHEQREAFLAFWEEWFVSERGHFKAAYNTFENTDAFEETFESHLRAWLANQGHVTGGTTWSLAEQGSPFCSLEPFDARHEEVFFGRDREVDRAVERLGRGTAGEMRRRFLLLIGESGSGKSSLARAGLVPRILRGALGGEPLAWRAAVMHPGAASDPLAALAAALFTQGALPEIAAGDFPTPEALAAMMGADAAMATRPVVNALGRIDETLRQRLGSETLAPGGLVVLVDQLEELFTPKVAPALAERFAAVLEALAATGRVVIIATLRSDAYADFARSPALRALRDAGDTLDVSTPSEADVAEIVRRPAEAAGLAFGIADPATGERLDDVILRAASGRDALPLLQFTLSRLYDAMRERLAAQGLGVATAKPADLVLTHADYEAFGGLEGAIGERAEEAFHTVDAAAQARLPRLLRALAEAEPSGDRGGAAGALRLFEVPWVSIAGDADADALAQALVDARILVVSQQSGGGRKLRLAHEAVLRSWSRARAIVAEHRDFFRIRSEVIAAERRHARHRAEHGARGADALLLGRGVPLAEAEQIRHRFADELPPDVVAYIDQSGHRARRRQRIMAAATVAFALTAAGAGGAAVLAIQHEQRASRNFELAVAQADALVSKIAEELKDLAVSRDALRRVLVAIEAQFDDIARVNPDHPRLLLSRARMLTAFADNFVDLGETTEAVRRSEECTAIARGLAARAPEDRDVAATLGHCLDRMGTAQRDRGRIEESIAAYEESLTLRRRLVAAEPGNVTWRRDLSDGLRSLGYALVSADRSAQSLAALEESLAIARDLARAAPDDPTRLRLLTDGLNTFAIVLSHLKRHAEALAHYEEATVVARRLVALDDANTTWRRYLSNILANSAGELVALGRGEEALKALEESLTLRRALVALDPGNMTWQRELAFTLVEQGNVLATLGRNEEALIPYRESVGIVRRVIEVDSGNVAWKNELRQRLPSFARILVTLGNRDEAITLLRETLVLWRESVEAEPDNLLQHSELAYLANHLGNLLHQQGRHAEARDAYAEAVEAMRRFAESKPDDAEIQRDFATMLGNGARTNAILGGRAEALAGFRESLAVWRRVVEKLDPSPAATAELIETLHELSRLDPSPRPLLEEALRLLRSLAAAGGLEERQKARLAEIEQTLAHAR